MKTDQKTLQRQQRQHALYAHLAVLDVPGMARRVRSMAAAGLADHAIADLTGLHVDTVRQFIAYTVDRIDTEDAP